MWRLGQVRIILPPQNTRDTAGREHLHAVGHQTRARARKQVADKVHGEAPGGLLTCVPTGDGEQTGGDEAGFAETWRWLVHDLMISKLASRDIPEQQTCSKIRAEALLECLEGRDETPIPVNKLNSKRGNGGSQLTKRGSARQSTPSGQPGRGRCCWGSGSGVSA